MKKLIGNTILILFILGQIAACQNKHTMTAEKEKLAQDDYNRPNEIWPTNKDENGDYYYGANMGAIFNYAAVNSGSYFITPKEDVSLNAFHLSQNWGDGSGSYVLNDQYHPIPDSLYVRWFSISEDKFYAGTFEMPKDILRKCFNEMWSGYRPGVMGVEAAKHDRYQDLVVGVAPGGGVSVWTSAVTQQIEIGHYQAKEIQMDWDKFAGINGFGAGTTRKGFIASHKDDITNPIPFGKAERYRTKFNWKPKVESDLPIEVTCYDLYMFNGEKESLYAEHRGIIGTVKRAVPNKVNFNWQIKGRNFYEKSFTLDEDDLYKAFDAICADKTTDAELVLKLDKNNELLKIILRSTKLEYVLKPKKVESYVEDYDSRIKSIEPVDKN